MNIEEKVKMNLMVRGFDSNTQLNNRGLIGATIDETILEVVKNLNIDNVSNRRELLIDFARSFKYRGEGFLERQIESVVNSYIKGN
uniref:Uncharacterized protein n=1 Tax=uncultured marine virus TaxID=186617 RepID=A0A0F7L7V8_9VIRU|nr:hypothetical protein [uncultured marine virus]